MTTPNWLERYRAGERQQVWGELAALGSAVRDDRASAVEAQQVCDEMARRARHNVDVVVGRLTRAGYHFHTNDSDKKRIVPHIPPTAAAPDLASWLEEEFEAVPMTLLSWLRIVGDVWLVGTHPEWSTSASADPLVLQVEGSHHPGHSIREYFAEEWEQCREDAEDGEEGTAFVLPLAPDRLHKEDASGGGPYGLVVPDASADGVFVAEEEMPFVEYLNTVFAKGGFPAGTGTKAEAAIRAELARDLLPL